MEPSPGKGIQYYQVFQKPPCGTPLSVSCVEIQVSPFLLNQPEKHWDVVFPECPAPHTRNIQSHTVFSPDVETPELGSHPTDLDS